MKNVASIVKTGSWAPHHAWYPALSHIPLATILLTVQSIHHATGLEFLRVQHETGWMLPIAYYLGRWLSVLYASLTVLLTYAIARTSFARGTATLAVFLLVAAPMFSWSAAIFKPDLLAVLWTLVAFLLAIGAGEKPHLRRYILAGVAIGLAASAKQIGAFAALPLVFATIWVGPRIKAWLGLAAAGATSALVFFSIHPSLHLVRMYLSMTKRYDGWALHQPEAPIPAAFYLPYLFTTDTWHGPVIGITAILGLVGLIRALLKSRGRKSSDLPKFLILAFVLSFPIGYAIVSSHPKDNIFLSTLPFTAIAASWFISSLIKWGVAKFPARSRSLIGSVLVASIVLIAGVPFVKYLHRAAVPTTTETLALDILSRWGVFDPHRTVISEGASFQWSRRILATEPNLPWIKKHEQLPSPRSTRQKDLADFEVFPLARLEVEDSPYNARTHRLKPTSVRVVHPQLFEVRGDPLVVLLHPWKPKRTFALNWTIAQDRRSMHVRLSTVLRARRAISFRVATNDNLPRACRIILGRRQLPLFQYRRSDGGQHFLMTERATLPGRPANAIFSCNQELTDGQIKISVIEWRLAKKHMIDLEGGIE